MCVEYYNIILYTRYSGLTLYTAIFYFLFRANNRYYRTLFATRLYTVPFTNSTNSSRILSARMYI